MMVAPQSPDCPDENELVMSMHGLLTPGSRAPCSSAISTAATSADRSSRR